MIQCIAIDDEYLALEVLENYTGRLPFMQLNATFTRAAEALPILATGNIDLVFLDIEMPDISGLDFLKTLRQPPLVIFTTAYSRFALQGFEVNAVDYLVKPIPFDRFLASVQKVQDRLTTKPSSLFIKSDHKNIRIDVDDLLYIEGKKDYISIHTRTQTVDSLLSISGLLEKLPANRFLRVHRSFVVAWDRIDRVERGQIVIGETRIPIGDQYREELMRRITRI